MTEAAHTLTASDGRALAATLFEPSDSPIGTVLILGAWAVQRRYYGRFATYLADNGFRVLTFDVRGIGDSLQGSIRDETCTTLDWAVLDHACALRWLAEQPGPRLAVGHSFGGQVFGILDEATCVEGLYLVASQLPWWGYQPWKERVMGRVWFTVGMPLITRLFGYLPAWAGLGSPAPRGAFLEWAQWLASRNYLLDFVPDARERFLRWPGVLRSVGFTDDTYAPPQSVRSLASQFPAERSAVHVLSPSDVGLESVGHFGFFRAVSGEPLWEPCLRTLLGWAVPT